MEAGRKAEVTNFASVPIDAFPDSVRNLLSKFDKDGDGTVDPAELQEAAKMFEAAQAAADGSIPIVQLPKELQPALGAFDVDGDGTIDPMELGRGAELYQASKAGVPGSVAFEAHADRFAAAAELESYGLGHHIAVRPDWDSAKERAMDRALRLKFAHPALGTLLRSTRGHRFCSVKADAHRTVWKPSRFDKRASTSVERRPF